MSLPRQRVTLITLGVADLDRARGYYAAWSWTPRPSDAEGVVFYQMHGAALALFPLDERAADQGARRPARDRRDRPGAELRRTCRNRCRLAVRRGGRSDCAEAPRKGVLGRLFRLYRGLRRACSGNRA